MSNAQRRRSVDSIAIHAFAAAAASDSPLKCWKYSFKVRGRAINSYHFNTTPSNQHHHHLFAAGFLIVKLNLKL